ncbi:MAG: peptide chain release factor 2 [Chloroflexi bacterium]|nr:peptide chain release factor 2 [Chloroflexota bacterium]
MFDLDSFSKEILRIEDEASNPHIWNDHENATSIMRKLSLAKKRFSAWENLKTSINDLSEVLKDSKDEEIEDFREDFLEEINKIENKLEDLEFSEQLSGEHDSSFAIISLSQGAGGVDAQDWTSMLMRMYLRWASRKGFEAEVLSRMTGEEAGIKSALIRIKGDYSYGYLKGEKGTHRLVRLSPFNANSLRHTSFALVEVMPELESSVEVNINLDDLRIDTFKASGHGGQSVQKNSSAVRITHLPTNIVVSVQNERSQSQNKKLAMSILKSRVMEIELEKKESEKNKIKGEHVSAEWGSQVRNYVLHPYQLVKDNRTSLEIKDVKNVLDGDLDDLLRAYLKTLMGKN